MNDISEQQGVFDEHFYESGAEKTELEVDKKFFVISRAWFEKWKTYIRRSPSPIGHTVDVCGRDFHPGKIDPTSICCDDELKPGLLLNTDVMVIPESLLDKLIHWFGINGDKNLIPSRKVYMTSDKLLTYDLYPPKLHFTPQSNGFKEFVTHFTSNDTLSDVKKAIREANNLTSSRNIVLIDAKNSDKLPDDDTTTLKEASLDGDNELLYEVSSNGLANGDATHPRTLLSRSTYPSLPIGACGLNNLGNTCFMNSAIQCLSNVPPLREYFLKRQYKKDINEDNRLGSGGLIARAFAGLICQMWDENNRGRSCVPRELKAQISRTAPQFAGYQQHDAQELLGFLLDFLNEDLNKISKKPYIEIKDADGRPDDEVAAEAWSDYKKRNDSIIVDLFHGLLKSTVTCNEFDIEILVWPNKKHNLHVLPTCRVVDVLNSLKRVRPLSDGHEYFVADATNGGMQVIPHASTENLRGLRLQVFELPVGAVVPIDLRVNGKTDVEPFLISLEKHQPNANCDDICCGVKAQLAKISRGCADQFESFRKEELLRFDPDAKIFSITPEDPIIIEMPGKLDFVISVTVQNHDLQLIDCLDLFLATEQLSERDPWYCKECKTHRQAFKKFDIWFLPQVLVIQLKRYRNLMRLHKNETFVNCPKRELEVFSAKGEKYVYDLVAVSNHMGGVGGGHYTAFGKNGSEWLNFDDSSVSRVGGQVVTRNAYFLVYMLVKASDSDVSVVTSNGIDGRF